MQRMVEATGKTIDEARQSAMRLLGVTDTTCVEFEELPEVKGLFNRTSKRVRATLGAEPVSVPAPAPVSTPEPPAAAVEAPAPAAATPAADQPNLDELMRVALGPDEDAIPAELSGETVQLAQQILQDIIEASGLKINASYQKTEGRYIHLEMSGPDVPHFIGKRGSVIDSLQYLMNVMISKGEDGPNARIVLDGDNYRMKRAETLQKLALELAAQVRSRKEEAELEALPAHERRIVHRVLRDDSTIKTYSEGIEPERRVIISPA